MSYKQKKIIHDIMVLNFKNDKRTTSIQTKEHKRQKVLKRELVNHRKEM